MAFVHRLRRAHAAPLAARPGQATATAAAHLSIRVALCKFLSLTFLALIPDFLRSALNYNLIQLWYVDCFTSCVRAQVQGGGPEPACRT